uniref:Bcl-x interacting BH3 domain-containing protein n=1 Tax=Strix occidentalis caurina TaxID=311401 RepID=A0A8D0FSN5_STROC
GREGKPIIKKEKKNLSCDPEIWIAQELRRIGDEFNASYCPRRVTFIFLLSISLHMASKREKICQSCFETRIFIRL